MLALLVPTGAVEKEEASPYITIDIDTEALIEK